MAFAIVLDLSTATIYGTKLQKYTTLRIDITTWGGENRVFYWDNVLSMKPVIPALNVYVQ